MIETILKVAIVIGILVMIGGGIKMYFDKKNKSNSGQ